MAESKLEKPQVVDVPSAFKVVSGTIASGSTVNVDYATTAFVCVFRGASARVAVVDQWRESKDISSWSSIAISMSSVSGGNRITIKNNHSAYVNYMVITA